MDKGEFYKFLPIIIMFAWQMVTPFLFPRNWQLRYMANMVGMVLSISFLVVTNEVLKWKSAEFMHVDMTCRPSETRLHIFISDLETVELEPGVYATKLTVGEGFSHPFYGEIEKGGSVVMKHDLPWELRMVFKPGKAIFKGQVVDHPKSARVIVWEPSGLFDMDHLNPIPVFLLKDAPGDYDLPEDKMLVPETMSEGLLQKTVVVGGERKSGASLLFDFHRQEKALKRMKDKNIELKRQSLHWHQVAMKLEEVNIQIKNELHSVYSSRQDQKQSVVEQVLAVLEAHVKIRSALSTLQGRWWLNKSTVMLIGVLVTIGIFLLDPGGIMKWLSIRQNQFFVVILAGVCTFAYYYATHRK